MCPLQKICTDPSRQHGRYHQIASATATVPIQHSVTLTWTASTSTVARYNVYRGPHSGGPYTRILHPQSRMYGSVALPAEADEILLGILALATSPVYVTDLKTGDRPAARRKYALL